MMMLLQRLPMLRSCLRNSIWQQEWTATHQAAPRWLQCVLITRHDTQDAPVLVPPPRHVPYRPPRATIVQQRHHHCAVSPQNSGPVQLQKGPSTARTCLSGNLLVGRQQLVALSLDQLVPLLQAAMVVAQSLQASKGCEWEGMTAARRRRPESAASPDSNSTDAHGPHPAGSLNSQSWVLCQVCSGGARLLQAPMVAADGLQALHGSSARRRLGGAAPLILQQEGWLM